MITLGDMSNAERVFPPARRRLLLGVVAAAVVSSLAGPVAPASRAAAPAKTVPYVEPPPPTPPTNPVPRPTGRLVPARGSLFGIHTIPDPTTAKAPADMGIVRREADSGRTMDIDNHYYAGFDAAMLLGGGKPVMPGWRETWDIQNGRIPMVSWGGADTLEITKGRYDAAIDAAAQRFQALGAPFFLRWFWEADGLRPSKKDLAHTPEDYIKAWRYIHDRFVKAGNTNAVWVWCPVSLNFYPPSGQTSSDPELAPNHAINPLGAQPFYPGDDVVDWMCADGYNWAPNKAGARYEPFQELFQAFYNWSVPHNKPLMVGETGVQENNPGDKANWLEAAHVAMTDHYPNIVAWLYFDTHNANGLNNEWWLESDPQTYQQWKDMAADPYFNVRSTLGEAPYGNGIPPPSATPPVATPPVVTPPGAQPGDRSGIPHDGAVPRGYWMLGADGAVYPFGGAESLGRGPAGVEGVGPRTDAVGRRATGSSPRTAGVGPSATPRPSATSTSGQLAAGERVTSLSATPTGKGYWVFTNRGRALAFGDAPFLGDMSAVNAQRAGARLGRHPDRARATTWSPPTAASSPSATPPSPGRWAASSSTPRSQSLVPDGDGDGLLAGRLRRRDLRLRRPLPGLDGRREAQPARSPAWSATATAT